MSDQNYYRKNQIIYNLKWKEQTHLCAPQPRYFNKRDGLDRLHWIRARRQVRTHGTHGRRAAARRGRHSPSARSEVARPTTTTTDGRRRRARSCGVRYRLAEETIEPNPTAGRAAPACAVMRCPQDRQGADEMRHAPSRRHGVGMGNSGSDRQPDAIGPNQEAGAISERAFCPQPGRGSSRDSAALVRWSLS